jgi:hypothetical protein
MPPLFAAASIIAFIFFRHAATFRFSPGAATDIFDSRFHFLRSSLLPPSADAAIAVFRFSTLVSGFSPP